MGVLAANDRFVRFLVASLRTPSESPTPCDGWTAHDVVAHVAAGSEELADLIELSLAGKSRATRDFESREAPYRAMSKVRLNLALLRQGTRVTRLVLRLQRAGRTIEFTGTTMTATEIFRHAESELVVHRYDLVGLDRVGRRQMSDPALVAHAKQVVGRMAQGVLPLRSASDVELLAIWGR
jgi:uncharacterized protein (TIGR03083 family)